jgi:hypothetical protein
MFEMMLPGTVLLSALSGALRAPGVQIFFQVGTWSAAVRSVHSPNVSAIGA